MSTTTRRPVPGSLLCLLLVPGFAALGAQMPAASRAGTPEAETLIVNAKVYTVNSRQPWAEAVTVAGGKAVYQVPNWTHSARDNPRGSGRAEPRGVEAAR
jgi:hypothetical protein